MRNCQYKNSLNIGIVIDNLIYCLHSNFSTTINSKYEHTKTQKSSSLSDDRLNESLVRLLLEQSDLDLLSLDQTYLFQ